MFTLVLYRMAFAPPRKSYRIELLYPFRNGDFGAILLRNEAASRRADLARGASLSVTYRIDFDPFFGAM